MVWARVSLLDESRDKGERGSQPSPVQRCVRTNQHSIQIRSTPTRIDDPDFADNRSRLWHREEVKVAPKKNDEDVNHRLIMCDYAYLYGT